MADVLTISVQRATLLIRVGAVPVGADAPDLGPDLLAIEALIGTGLARRTSNSPETWTVGGVVTVAEGGTGATTEVLARAALGLAIGVDVPSLATFAVLAAVVAGLPTPTAFALTFLDDVDGPAVRTTLGLVIGTNVHPWDAGLASLATVDTAADLLPYTTAANAWAGTALSAFMRTVLDDTTAALARATLSAADAQMALHMRGEH